MIGWREILEKIVRTKAHLFKIANNILQEKMPLTFYPFEETEA